MYISVLTLSAFAAKSEQSKKKKMQRTNKRWQRKKRRIQHEGRKFQPQWGNDYFFTEVNGRRICLICNDTVAVMKDYNVRQHYETKHPTYTSYTDVEREEKVKKMTATVLILQLFIFRVQASYEVAQLIARHGKPFSEREFIKQCLAKVARIMCPDKMQDLNVSMSTKTVVQRSISHIGLQ